MATGQKVWCDSVHGTLIAKAKGTFDAINTNQNNVKIQKKDATAILGFIVNYCLGVTTDAENLPDLVIRATNKALGITEEDLVIPLGGTDGDANTPYIAMGAVYEPFKIPDGKEDKLFGSEFIFKASPTITNTGGLEIAVGVIYSNQEPDEQFTMELLAQKCARSVGGAYNADAAKAHGTGGAAVTLSSLAIPSGPTELIGLLGKINPNAITAGDPIAGIIEYKCSGIDDFSPQVWPLCVFFNPVLGTVAEGGSNSGRGRYYPTRFPLTGHGVTVGVETTLTITANDAPDTTQALKYR